jgi:hypothetical protein
VAGMIAGAECIDDLDLLRHGGMSRMFTSIPAPSTLGSFLRSFCWGDTRALESVARSVLARLAAAAPLPDKINIPCAHARNDHRLPRRWIQA